MISALKHAWGMCKVIAHHAPSLPHYWMMHLVNLSMWILPDDRLSEQVRASLLRLAGATLGRGANVRQGARFRDIKNLRLGDEASLGSCSYIDCAAQVTIGHRVVLSPQVTILTATHDLGGQEGICGSMRSSPVTIEEGAWLCYGCIILPGVTVGKMSVVAAGSVVTADVPEYVMVAGAPARVVKELKQQSGTDCARQDCGA